MKYIASFTAGAFIVVGAWAVGAHADPLPAGTWFAGLSDEVMPPPYPGDPADIMPPPDPSAVMENTPADQSVVDQMNTPPADIGDQCVSMNNGNEAMRDCWAMGKNFGENQ